MRRTRLASRSLIATLSVVAVALAACGGGSSPPSGPTPTAVPASDRFYAAPPNLASLSHGAVIRTRPATISELNRSILAGAETVLFASTDIHGNPIAASELVLTPTAKWAGGGTRPVLVDLPPYDSLGTECDPSYTLPTGAQSAAMTVAELRGVLPGGTEIVVPDYEGPQALFGIGDQEGRIVLDGIKAAEATGNGGIDAQSAVATWGYSGGGLASAWSAELAPSYAADINLIGVAEGGVPADVKSSFALLDGTDYVALAVMALVAIDRAYPHAGLASSLTDTTQTLFHDIASTCGGTQLFQTLAGTKLDSLVTTPNLLATPQLQPIFAAMRLGQHVPTAPIYNYQGTQDEVVGFAPDRDLVQHYCNHGAKVDFAPINGADHVAAATQGIAGVVTWLQDRFAGKPAPDNCTG